MEKYLQGFDVPAKHPSEDAVRRWRDAVSLVKNRQRRFRHVSDLEKRSAHQDRQGKIKEDLRISLFATRAALRFMDAAAEPEPHIKPYRLQEVLRATNNFSDENLIKEGGVGKLYKGQIGYGSKDIVARRLNREHGQGDIEFQTEISMLSNLDHTNIISTFGYCDEGDEKIIIYEQAFHGCLDQHLSDPTTLTWSRRLQICIGVARALNYLHYDVIHCDISSSKIFLDEDWEAKIYGFELSTNYPQSWRHRLLYSRYFKTSIMTPKYDVYSFGVLLFEVLCGRKPLFQEDVVKEELDKIIDPNLRDQMDTQSLDVFLNTVKNCLNQELVQRPTMDQIVKELEEALEHQWKHENLEHPTVADEDTSSNHLKMDILKIPLSEIRLATNDFDKEYCLGSGGYGIVYKAVLNVLDIQMEGKYNQVPKINKTVAIKRIFSRPDEQGKQGFLTEIELLTSCKHENIVSLLGFSDEKHEMILVYEYACNGSLSDYLTGTNKKVNLTWAQRIQICIDTACGINYLHTNMEGKPRIIHRDIKSENILLDENMKAKIADFGLSKFHPANQQASTIHTKRIAGTEVYLDPEYLTTGKYKKESDVYSFGVVLFEVLSGRLAYDSFYMMENDKGLAPIARRRFNEKTLKELIDPKIVEEDGEFLFTLNRGPTQDSFDAFSKIAYQCLAETQAKRPTMDAIIKELHNALKLQGETMVLSRFGLKQIELATKKFSETYCIGEHAHGKVYKVKLDHFDSDSPTIAIKRTREKGFFEEIETRANKHPNIVSLLGFCDEGDNMILVYEYPSNGSLSDYIRDSDNMGKLTWTQRLHKCLEIAHGINHLHTMMDLQKGVVHGDIRSANILLGKNWEPKIAYFGVLKLNSENQEAHISTKVYRDPEYEKTRELKRESDVYSFGVMLIEIFCGRLSYDPDYLVENDSGLAPIARRRFNDGTIKEIIDPRLIKEETNLDVLSSNRGPNRDSLDTFIKIARKCLDETQAERPTMEVVIRELEKALNFQENPMKRLQISVKDIESATENFSQRNCIGTGRYWMAYKGELLKANANANANAIGRTTIVAKRWVSKSRQVHHQFQREVDILTNHKHENIIRLVGYNNEMNEAIIAYEHTSNGSLDMHLGAASLTWMRRLKICIDIANGLEFLHRGDVMLKKVVHRNIQSANILLTNDWKAKISNLELSSLDTLPQDMEHVSDNVYGAFGYLDPQYKQGFLTDKSDIYSLGVVLFEILCGRLAWAEDCESRSQSLGLLAKRRYEEGKLDEMIFEGIKDQIGPESLVTFEKITYECLHDKSEERPTAREVVIQLKKALDAQEDYENWEAKLPKDYKEIIQMSETPEIYSTAKRKDIYDILSKGILIQEGEVWFSLGNNGERYELASPSQFSYGNLHSHKWLSVPKSRFHKIVEMPDVSNLKIQVKIKTQSLSLGVHYGVHLVFKFCGPRESVAKQMYVNLRYKMGNDQMLHAYFATRREDGWMTVELYRFLNHKEDAEFEFLLESFSRCYCESRAIYVEGIECRAISNVNHEDNNNLQAEVHQVLNSTSNMDPMQQLPTNIPYDICTDFTQTLLKLFSWRNNDKYYMISAKEALCDYSNSKFFDLKPLTQSKFQKVIELRSTQVFRIKCNIESQMLLPNREYMCYLVFKLSEKCCGLHCPVIVRDLHKRRNRNTEIIYFRPPVHSWNLDDFKRVPKEREDGWMEVNVWKFKSSDDDCISINLKVISYEGTMSGLIVRGLEFRQM